MRKNFPGAARPNNPKLLDQVQRFLELGLSPCVTLSSSRNAVSFSSARTTKRSRSLVEIPGIAICLAEWRNMVLRCFQDGFLGHVHEYLGFLVTDPIDMLR
jgi:hypothetical protein